MNKQLEREVWWRAGDRCEYCQVAASFYRTPFQIDPVIARQHGGATIASNLALACFHCNTHKGPNVAGMDRLTGKVVRLFRSPRRRLAETLRVGRCRVGRPDGRVTVAVLAINHPDAIAVRESLIREGVKPHS